MGKIKCEIYNDSMQNWKKYPIQKAQLIIADVPYNVGNNFYSSDAPCMIVFCSFEQIPTLINAAEKHGFIHNIPLIFCKNYSPQVLKANMRICGATEYAILFYRSYLQKFRNNGKMIFNWFEWKRDSAKEIPKIHPAQKPVNLLKRLIEILTDEGDVVIDPCCGSGSTLRAAMETGRNSYGFEISKTFYEKAKNEMLVLPKTNQISIEEYLKGEKNDRV